MNHLLHVIVVQLHAFLPPLHPALETGAEKVCAAAADPFPHYSLQLVVVFIPMASQMVFQWFKEMEVSLEFGHLLNARLAIHFLQLLG